LPLLALVLVIFLAGCVGQSTGTGGTSNGVIIKSFSPDFSEVAPSEPVTLTLTVQNVGDADATNVVAELFTLNPAEWTGGSFSTLSIGTLVKAVPADKVPGGDWTGQWDLTAPTINVPTKSYTATARVKYEYQTTASATLRFITNDYLRSLQPSEQEKAKKNSGIVSQLSSNAPIKISFSASSRPFVLVSTTGSSAFAFQITLTNVGQGNPFSGSVSGSVTSTNLYHVTISQPNIAGTNVQITCPSLASGLDIKLPRGESKTISCTATVSGVNNVLEGGVDVTLTYNYLVDASTSVTITQQS
jgi:hypothetical protein